MGRDNIMNYVMQYEFDNVEDHFDDFRLKIRNGACFEIMDCLIKYCDKDEKYLLIWTNGNVSSNKAEEKINIVAKLLTFLVAGPVYDSKNHIKEVSYIINKNTLLGKKKIKELDKAEKKICKFVETKVLFYEILDLISIAFENLYNNRDEDAFTYFFKVIEKLAKSHYLLYMKRYHTKNYTRRNKDELRKFMKNYGEDFFNVILTTNILDRKIDMLYKNLKVEFYGSIFGKISLLLKRHGIIININKLSELVKVRNKIAHGDMVESEKLQNSLGYCEDLALNIVSKYFFNCRYENLHIKSERFNGCGDFYIYK